MVMMMVSSTALAVASLRALPVASIRLITAGVTLSLKRNCTVFGACAKTLPSAGSVETSEACASTPVAKHTTDSNVARPAIRRVIQALWFRYQFDGGRRRLAVMRPRLAVKWNIDPAANPLFAFLHHRKIQIGVRLEGGGQEGVDDELVVIVVRQPAAAPHHLLDTIRQFGAVIIVIGGIFSLDDLDIPAGLRHRLRRDHAFRNLNPDLDGSRAGAPVRHLKHRLVGRSDRRLAIFQRDMRAGRRQAERGGGDGETPVMGLQHHQPHIFCPGFMSISMSMAPDADPGPCAPTPCTSNESFTLPAFSNSSVTDTLSPRLSGLFRSNIIR